MDPSPILPTAPVLYEPGTAQMPPFPFGYRPPLPATDDPSIVPEGDIERLVGGDVYCETYLERDLLPAKYRREGITVAYVKQPSDSGEQPGDSFWYLRDGIDNACWVPVGSANQGTLSGLPAIIRCGNADPAHFPPASRFVLY